MEDSRERETAGVTACAWDPAVPLRLPNHCTSVSSDLQVLTSADKLPHPGVAGGLPSSRPSTSPRGSFVPDN